MWLKKGKITMEIIVDQRRSIVNHYDTLEHYNRDVFTWLKAGVHIERIKFGDGRRIQS